jgi:hypothetical protein
VPHSAEGDEERLVLRAVAALVAFVFAAGVAVALTRTEADDSAVDVPTVDAGPLLIGTGPLPGTSVPEYLARRRAALGRLQGRAVAVVSFDAYRTERDARALVEPTEVLGLLVAAPGGAPSVTTQPPATWSTQERTAAEAERAELGRLRQTSEDPEFAAGFDADITRLGALLERLDSTASVVFGAVVVADAGQLRVLAGRSGVRLVDPVSKDVPDDLVVLAGLRPEETERAGTPRTRPLP